MGNCGSRNIAKFSCALSAAPQALFLGGLPEANDSLYLPLVECLMEILPALNPAEQCGLLQAIDAMPWNSTVRLHSSLAPEFRWKAPCQAPSSHALLIAISIRETGSQSYRKVLSVWVVIDQEFTKLFVTKTAF
jgi:hypothetical protein